MKCKDCFWLDNIKKRERKTCREKRGVSEDTETCSKYKPTIEAIICLLQMQNGDIIDKTVSLITEVKKDDITKIRTELDSYCNFGRKFPNSFTSQADIATFHSLYNRVQSIKDRVAYIRNSMSFKKHMLGEIKRIFFKEVTLIETGFKQYEDSEKEIFMNELFPDIVEMENTFLVIHEMCERVHWNTHNAQGILDTLRSMRENNKYLFSNIESGRI